MLSALLQGRAQFSFSEVRSRNHILLYTHVLGLVDLLQPQVFQLQYSTAFESLLHAYFDLLIVRDPVLSVFIACKLYSNINWLICYPCFIVAIRP